MKSVFTALAAAVLLGGAAVPSHAFEMTAGGQAISMGSNSAALQFLGGASHLTFNDGHFDGAAISSLGGAVGTLNVLIGRSVISSEMGPQGALGAGVSSETFQYGNNGRFQALSAVTWQTPSIASASIGTTPDGLGVQFDAFALQGGLTFSIGATAGTAQGGSVQMSNLRVDVKNRQVIADLSGTSLGPSGTLGDTFSSPDTVVWTAAGVTGPAMITPDSLSTEGMGSALPANGFSIVDQYAATPSGFCPTGGGGYGNGFCPSAVYYSFQSDMLLSNLEMTPAGMAFLHDALGLLDTGDTALAAVNTSTEGKWGSLALGAIFRAVPSVTQSGIPVPASIPEPSTYLMMGLGLVGVLLAKRR